MSISFPTFAHLHSGPASPSLWPSPHCCPCQWKYKSILWLWESTQGRTNLEQSPSPQGCDSDFVGEGISFCPLKGPSLLGEVALQNCHRLGADGWASLTSLYMQAAPGGGCDFWQWQVGTSDDVRDRFTGTGSYLLGLVLFGQSCMYRWGFQVMEIHSWGAKRFCFFWMKLVFY